MPCLPPLACVPEYQGCRCYVPGLCSKAMGGAMPCQHAALHERCLCHNSCHPVGLPSTGHSSCRSTVWQLLHAPPGPPCHQPIPYTPVTDTCLCLAHGCRGCKRQSHAVLLGTSNMCPELACHTAALVLAALTGPTEQDQLCSRHWSRKPVHNQHIMCHLPGPGDCSQFPFSGSAVAQI